MGLFTRYFTLGYRRKGSALNILKFSLSNDREKVSTIIPGLVYLSNLPRKLPFDNLKSTLLAAGSSAEGLVVSCLDLFELADSKLLLEPENTRIHYHVLTMEDCTAKADSLRHILTALNRMSSYADKKIPLHIHCREGVGRSAMITATHIAHRYLKNDPIIVPEIEALGALDAKQDHFLDKLYQQAARLVKKNRSCCQFDSAERKTIALSALKALHQAEPQNEEKHSVEDHNYFWMYDLVQSAEYKKFVYMYYHDELFCSPTKFNLPQKIKPTATVFSFAIMLEGDTEKAYQQLTEALDSNQKDGHALSALCAHLRNPDEKPSANTDLLTNLASLRQKLENLAAEYPKASYSAVITESVASRKKSVSVTPL